MNTIETNKEYSIFWVNDKGEEKGYSKINWTGGYLKHPTKNIIVLDFVNILTKKAYSMSNTYFKKNAVETKTLQWTKKTAMSI